MWRRYIPRTNWRSLREDFHQPHAALRKCHGHRRGRARTSGQDGHEPHDVSSHGLPGKMAGRHQPDDLAPIADDDLGPGGKLRGQLGTKLRPRDRPPNHERSRRADIDDVEVPELFGERGRPEDPVTPDVDASQQDDECHGFSPSIDDRATPPIIRRPSRSPTCMKADSATPATPSPRRQPRRSVALPRPDPKHDPQRHLPQQIQSGPRRPELSRTPRRSATSIGATRVQARRRAPRCRRGWGCTRRNSPRAPSARVSRAVPRRAPSRIELDR